MGGKGGSFQGGSTTVNFNKFDRRTDGGWISGSSIAAAAMTAIAAINTAAAKSMNDKQVEIARGHLQLSQQLQAYWFGTFVPREVTTLAEAFSHDKYQPRYAWLGQQFEQRASYPFSLTSRLMSTASRYCTMLTADLLREIGNARNAFVADSMNFSYRYEENRKDAMDAVRWDRQIQAVGLGRDLIKDSLSYSRAAEGTFAQVGQRASAAASSAIEGAGYFIGRAATQTPQNTYRSKGEYGMPSRDYGKASFDDGVNGYSQKMTLTDMNRDADGIDAHGLGGAAAGNSGS